MKWYVQLVSNNQLYFCCLVMLTTLCAIPESILAKENFPIRIHGFVSQGLVSTDHNQFFGDSKSTSHEFTDLGLGASWRPLPALHFSTQALYRRAGALAPDEIQLNYAFLNYSIKNTSDFGFGTRIGRIKNTYGLLNETRDVASTRGSIILPQSIYLAAIRDAFHTSDSIGFYSYKTFGDHIFNLDFLHGRPRFDEIANSLLVPFPLEGDFDNQKLSLIRVITELNGGALRLAFSYGSSKGDVVLSENFKMTYGNLNTNAEFNLHLVSLEYNRDKVQLTSEYQWADLTYNGIRGPNTSEKRTTISYYLQALIELAPKWKALARYDEYYLDSDDKSGEKNPAIGYPKHNGFAKDLTLGIRYHPTRKWMIAAEIHNVKGTAWVSEIENPDPNQLNKYWNLFTLQGSYKF